MTEQERSRRRRGKRGGRGRGGGGGESREIQPSQHQPDIPAPVSGEAPAAGGEQQYASISGQRPSGAQSRRERRPSGAPPDASPMDFWRSGRARSHRDRPVTAGTKRGGGGIGSRIRNMYLPPWVPVAAIIIVVFGILGLLFATRSATGAPRISDHWHATYTFYACGEKQPNAPTWEGVGVHTHGDGVIHIHPFTAGEEGAGARLVKWFEYGQGKLDSDEIRLPGLSKTWKNGEVCPEGTPEAGKEGEVQVFVNSEKLSDWSRYIPKDGDRVRLVFGPSEEFTQLDDRIVLPESLATETIEVTIDGNEDTSRFTPESLQMKAGEAVKVVLTNNAAVSHGMRFAGADGEYDTADDFVVVPEGSDPEKADQGDVIEPGGKGFAIVRFDEAGTIEFKDPTATNPTTEEPFAKGTVIVTESGTATPGPGSSAEQTVDVVLKDNFFDPEEITIEAGKTFQINLTNEGQFVHNLRIDGPDGEFETEDDISSEDVFPGEDGVLLTDKTLAAGAYRIRDDFHEFEMTGTLVVQ